MYLITDQMKINWLFFSFWIFALLAATSQLTHSVASPPFCSCWNTEYFVCLLLETTGLQSEPDRRSTYADSRKGYVALATYGRVALI